MRDSLHLDKDASRHKSVERQPRCRVGPYFRREGLYSSQVTEWRRFRDAGVLAGREPGEHRGAEPGPGGHRSIAPAVEVTERRRPRPRPLADQGKSARALGDDLRELGHRSAARAALMQAHTKLLAAGVTTRPRPSWLGSRGPGQGSRHGEPDPTGACRAGTSEPAQRRRTGPRAGCAEQ